MHVRIKPPFFTCRTNFRLGNKVDNNLSVSPSQMHQAMLDGVPISSSSPSLDIAGTPNPSWDIPPEYKRGADINDLWAAQKAARKKLHDGAKVAQAQKELDNA